MKMTKEDFEILKKGLEKTELKFREDNGVDPKKYYLELGLSEIRYVWDMYHSMNSYIQPWKEGQKEPRFWEHLYSYLNDSHIETALRKILLGD